MTREEIIALAREAGGTVVPFSTTTGPAEAAAFTAENLERFFAKAYAAGAEAEREECAKVCEQYRYEFDGNCMDAAFAIRARGQA